MEEREHVAQLLAAVHEAGHAVVARVLRGPGAVYAIDVRASEGLTGSSHISFEPPQPASRAAEAEALCQIGAFFAAGRSAVQLALDSALGLDADAVRQDPWLRDVAERGCALDDEKVTECATSIVALRPALEDGRGAVSRVVRAALNAGAAAAEGEMRTWATGCLHENAERLFTIAAELVRVPRMTSDRFEVLFIAPAGGKPERG